MEDRRSYSRILFSVPVTLVSQDNKWQCQLIDLSLNGALVSVPEKWSLPSDELMLRFSLCGDVIIQMQVKVVASTEQLIHLKCENIDLDSLTHLKRLVELNLPDAGILERELAQLSNQ